MPRTLGTSVALVPKLGNAEAVYLMEFQFSSSTLRLNTGAQDITWNGNTWTAVGGAIDLEPVSETTDQQGQGLAVSLSGVDQSYIAVLLSQGHRGRLCNVWLAHLHASTNLMGAPELLTDSSTWSGNGVGIVVTRDTSVKPYGNASWRADLPNLSGAGPYFRQGHPAGYIPVVPGTQYTMSLDVLGDANMVGKTFRFIPHWWDGATYDTSAPGVNITLKSGWNRYSHTGQCPAGRTMLLVAFYLNGNPGVTGSIWVTGAKVEPGVVATPYERGYDAVVQAGTVVINPIPMGVYYMNEGFKVEETRDEKGANGTVKVSTRLVSRLAILSKQRGLRTNVDSHQALFPGDNFFKFVSTLTHKRIKWGS